MLLMCRQANEHTSFVFLEVDDRMTFVPLRLAHLVQKEGSELDKRTIRSSPLGKDRNHNRYWFFSKEGRIFVESNDSASWGYYSGKDEV